MRDLTLSQAARAARNAATIVAADAGSGRSSIRLYAAQGGTLLAVRQLAKPCGAVRQADGRIQLATGDSVDLVLATGAATWGEWLAADGTVLATGQVTDAGGMVTSGAGVVDTGDVGPWVLLGASGTQLYEGGLVLLASGVIG